MEKPGSKPDPILLVEDNPGAARGLRELLVSKGFRVDVARTPAEALDRADSRHYGLLVADFDLDGEDASELIRTLRRTHPDLPVLAVTARERSGETLDPSVPRLDGFLQKPVDPARLLAEVARLAGGEEVPVNPGDRE